MITVIISQHGDPTPFWFTTVAISLQLQELGIPYEYSVVSHGCPDKDYLFPYIHQMNAPVTWQHFAESLGAQTARQRASVSARGDILYFSEDHILITPSFFKRALMNFDNGVDALHSALKMSQADPRHYQYKLDGLEETFWGSGESHTPLKPEPYRIALGNHGSWFVRRSVFEEIGGYGPEELFTGYAGEESYVDFKLALLDKTNWLDPLMTHYHHTVCLGGKSRGYPSHFSDDYYRNLMTCALVIGGEKWIDSVFANFIRCAKVKSDRTMHDLYEQAHERGAEHAAYIASIQHRTLDEQLEKFRLDGVAH